jgi:hypothetical protein
MDLWLITYKGRRNVFKERVLNYRFSTEQQAKGYIESLHIRLFSRDHPSCYIADGEGDILNRTELSAKHNYGVFANVRDAKKYLSKIQVEKVQVAAPAGHVLVQNPEGHSLGTLEPRDPKFEHTSQEWILAIKNNSKYFVNRVFRSEAEAKSYISELHIVHNRILDKAGHTILKTDLNSGKYSIHGGIFIDHPSAIEFLRNISAVKKKPSRVEEIVSSMSRHHVNTITPE